MASTMVNLFLKVLMMSHGNFMIVCDEIDIVDLLSGVDIWATKAKNVKRMPRAAWIKETL